MQLRKEKGFVRSKVLTGVLSATLVGALALVPALADELDLMGTNMESPLEVADSAEQDATSQDHVVVEGNDRLSEGDTTGKTPVETSSTMMVSFVERGWDGTKVTEDTRTRDDVLPLPHDEDYLGSGWYYLDDFATFDRSYLVYGNAHIILGKDALFWASKGIYVMDGCTLSIYNQGDKGGRLVAKPGDNSSGPGAGIGAAAARYGGNVVVHGGTIEAHGGKHCAGIGSSADSGSNVGSFTMYGGTVTAEGGGDGAGIGGGRKSEANVKIYGGEVHASAQENGAGIGGGNNADAGTVEIHGGSVYTTHRDGAGIGGGENGGGGTITITGGDIHCDYKNQGNGAGIGAGNGSGACGTISISGGDVTTENNHGDGIGGGRSGSADDAGDSDFISITGGTVHASSKEGYGICTDGTLEREGDESAGNEGVSDGGQHAATVTISDGADVTAEGRKAGIGGGSGSVTIKGGTVTAKGFEDDGGMGVKLSNKSRLSVTGGILNATGVKKQAAISAGHLSFTGGATDAQAKEKAITGFKDMVVSGKDTMLKASSDNDRSIDDKKVQIEDGATVESWSGGKDGQDAFQIDDKAMVLAGRTKDEAQPMSTDDRYAAFVNRGYKHIIVKPCTHDEWANPNPESETQHVTRCKYCESAEHHEHAFAGGHTCTECGYEMRNPYLVHPRALTDGTLGIELIVQLPKLGDDAKYANSVMSFKVGGKGGETFEVPFSQARKIEDNLYGFACPLSCIQMGDAVTATYSFDDGERPSGTAEMWTTLSACCDSDKIAGQDSRVASIMTSIVNYGHYAQELLARERGWKLGDDHAAIDELITYSDQTCKEAQEKILNVYGAPSVDRAEDVRAVRISTRLNSRITVDIRVEADRALGGVTVDGEALPAGSWRREGSSWSITLPEVSARDALKGHSVVVTSVDGDVLVSLGNVSPVTYAGAVLASEKLATDDVLRKAMAACFNYCEACK